MAKKFGCSIRDLINANKNLGTFELAGDIFFCVKGKKQAFETSFSEEPMYMPISVYGEEIKIPKKLEADDSALQNRLDSEGVKKEIEQAKIENQKIIARLKAADEANTKRNEAEQKARQKKEEHDARVSNATMIALDFYEIADEYSSNNSLLKMKELLTNKVNKDNIMYFLEAYSNPNVRKEDSSVIDTVLSEYGAPVYKRQVLTLIWNALVAKARDAKVSENNISSLTAKFNKELDEVDFTPSSPTQLEIHLDALYKLILAAGQNVENVNEDEAMQEVAQGFDEVNDNATKEFETAREEEGWVAVTGDWICGLFGCNTIDEMRAKLGENADKVAKLAEAANKKDKTTFKKIYKELFGIDFDPKVVAAYSKHQEKLGQVIALDESIKIIDEISEQAKNLDYSALVEMIKEKFDYDDATIATIIEEFADSHVMSASNEKNKKDILIAFLKETRQEINTKMLNLSGGKSIKDLEKESEKLSTAAYGTNDIGKMVAEFNKNMVYTEMGAQIGLEIAGTIVLQFVPGLGQAAAAAMAARLANWGYKGVKIAKCLTSLSKGLATVKKVQQGAATGSKIANKVGQVAMASVNAGMATAAVNLSDGKDVKTTLHRTLMNMAFAGAGMTSNILAPKLMQAFGVSKQIAIECAEEIINAAAAYGITTIQGENYGSQDAFLDFVTGLLMARFSHIKPVSKVKAQASNTDNTVSGTKRTSDTNYTESSSNNSRVENNTNTNTNTNTKTETENKTSAQPEAGAETSNKKTSADTGAEAPKNKKSENISGEENVNRQETQETKTSTKERIKAEAERVKQKYGKKIARTYAAILRGIESMKTSVDFNKISKKIKEKFANYADLSKELWEKLKTKAKELNLKIKEFFDNGSKSEKTDNSYNSRTNNSSNTDNSQRAENSQRTENSQSRQSQYRHSEAEWDAYSRFNKNQQPLEFPKQGRLDPNAQYILDENNLPKLYIYRQDSPIILDFNTPKVKQLLANLKEGEFITLGRQGTFVISDDGMVSRQHILITRHNGQLQIKDLSTNGTYCSSGQRSRQNDNSYSNQNNYRSQNSSNTNNSERSSKPSKKYNTGKNTYTDKFIADTEYFLNRIQKASDVSKLKNTELKELADVIGISIDDLKTLSSKGENGKASTEAKKVYRKLAVKFHPDKTGSDEVAEMIFKLIANIYNI